MFAGAAREAVFSNAEVIRRIQSDFIPVALKAGEVNRPPQNLEGKLYQEIARSKIAPQGICVTNSAGKVLSWSLMFQDNKQIVKFLDYCVDRYKAHPDASKPVDAHRFMRFPEHRLADVKDTRNQIKIPDDAKAPKRKLEKGTLVGRIIGRALDKKGNPLASTLRQEEYLEAQVRIPVEVQKKFTRALKNAEGKRFAVPQDFGFVLVSNAYLGQLDVNPLGGDQIRGRIDRKSWSFHAERVSRLKDGTIRARLVGVSDVEGSGRGGRQWRHEVKLRWEGYLDVKDQSITRLLVAARGREKLRWGPKGWTVTNAVANLPAGRPINVECDVIYGLLATPAKD